MTLELESKDSESCIQSENTAQEQIQAVLIKHAQSLSEVGQASRFHDMVQITEKGRKQSRALAKFWTEKPSVIVHSPNIRTYQTAIPTINKFIRRTPVVVWPVQDFQFMNYTAGGSSILEERLEEKKLYWERQEPGYTAGGIGESFENFWNRVDSTLLYIKNMQPGRLIFTDEDYMNMVAFRLNFPQYREPDNEAMKQFSLYDTTNHIQNTARVCIYKTLGGILKAGDPQISHLKGKRDLVPRGVEGLSPETDKSK